VASAWRNRSMIASGTFFAEFIEPRILFIAKFRIVLPKQSRKRGRRAIRRGVDGLNQAINIRGHNEQITNGCGSRIPKGVRRSAWYENCRSCTGLYHVFAGLNAQSAFEDVPRFIVITMHVKRSDQAARSWLAAGITPFRDHEGIAGGANGISSKQRSDGR